MAAAMETNGIPYNHEEMVNMVYEIIRDIRDPEKPETLEELNVISEEGIFVKPLNQDTCLVTIEFIPTVPHCSLATLIGLCLRVKLTKDLPQKHKVEIFVKEGTHDTANEVNKQINDKERVAAALENPRLKELVNECIAAPD